MIKSKTKRKTKYLRFLSWIMYIYFGFFLIGTIFIISKIVEGMSGFFAGLLILTLIGLSAFLLICVSSLEKRWALIALIIFFSISFVEKIWDWIYKEGGITDIIMPLIILVLLIIGLKK